MSREEDDDLLMIPNDQLFSVPDAAARIGYAPDQLRDMIRKGAVKALRISANCIRVSAGELKRFRKTLPYKGPGTKVYVMRAGPFVKIGFTTDVNARMSALQIGSPHPLEIVAVRPGNMETERRLHKRFRSLRSRGEWFFERGHLARWISKGCPL